MKAQNFRKVFGVALVFNLIFLPILPAQVAHAQFGIPVPVVEIGPSGVANVTTAVNSTTMSFKEQLFDALAFGFMNYAIQRIAANTVQWINSGFKGSPAFVTDPEGFLKKTADQTVGAFIEKDPRLNFLCSPIQNRIKIALVNSYAPNNNLWQCTLTDAVGNMENFLDDFDRGGWDKFFEISQKQQNSPIGAYIMAENELYSQVASKVGVKQQDLNWGKGFMSFKSCARYAGIPEAQRTIDVPTQNPDGSFGNRKEVIPDTCVQESTETPGTVIESRLNDALGSGGRRLEAADEINEIVGALLTQLANKALGGLRGLTQRGSDGSASYVDQSRSDAQDQALNKYFSDSQNNVQTSSNTTVFDPSICISNPQAPGCSIGTGSSSSGLPVRPRDPDCSAYSDSEIANWAMQLSSNSGVSYEEAILNLDCERR